MTLFNSLSAATEPHDIYALAIVFIIIIIAMFTMPWLLIIALFIIAGVIVDLTAHGWDH